MQSDKRKRSCEWRVPLTAEKKLIVIAYLLEVIHSGEKNFGLVLSRRLHPARLSLVRPMVLCFLLCAFSVGADFFQIPTNPTRMHLGFKWPKTSFPAPHTRHRRNLILLVACTIHTTVSSEMINASIYLTLNWRARVANLHSFYCSRECQTIHWKKKKGGHKLACEHMKQACEDAASRLVNVISDGNHRPLDGCGWSGSV